MADSDMICSKLIEFTNRAIKSLGAIEGVFHTEIFVKHDGTFVFLESGHRPAGLLINRMYELSTGVNLLNVDVRIQAQLPIDCFTRTQELSQAFYLMYPKKKGRVGRVNELFIPDGLSADYQCWVQKDDVHTECTSNLDSIASIVCSGHGVLLDEFYKKMTTFQPVSYCDKS